MYFFFFVKCAIKNFFIRILLAFWQLAWHIFDTWRTRTNKNVAYFARIFMPQFYRDKNFSNKREKYKIIVHCVIIKYNASYSSYWCTILPSEKMATNLRQKSKYSCTIHTNIFFLFFFFKKTYFIDFTTLIFSSYIYIKEGKFYEPMNAKILFNENV